MEKIHPTAIVNENAVLGKNITVEPYAIIEENVEIGDNCYIGKHAVIYNGARVGNNVTIHQGASIANVPQDLKFGNEETILSIGDGTTVREFATLNRATKDSGITKIGKDCLFMAYSHVGHDVVVGDNVILANGVQIGGHVEIGDWVIIGGMTPVHQFCKVGQHAMIGGGFRATQDVPPYVIAASEPLRYTGLNLIGLRRRGFTNDQITLLKKVYDIIYNSGLNLSQAKERINNEYPDDELVGNVMTFLANSTRSIIRK